MRITSWRIVQAEHLPSALTGEGAAAHPGRWNHRGTPVIYTAGSLSLATLEMLVHLDAAEVLSRYLYIPVSFDESLCRTMTVSDLPADWADDPAPPSTRDIGTAWAKSNGSLVLAVPSTVVRIETNFLINPRHLAFGQLEIGAARPFPFDARLLKTPRR